MKFFVCLCVAIVSFGKAAAQVNETVLADTVVFITEAINDLESVRINQEIYRLNFDDCNLELTVYDKDTETEDWNIESFWLPDLDEKQMQLTYLDETEEWALRLVCANEARKIKSSSNFNTGTTFEVYLHSAKKEPLISIGQALYYAIHNCKGLDRFKNGK